MRSFNPDAGGAGNPSGGVLHCDRTGPRNFLRRRFAGSRGDDLNRLALQQVTVPEGEITYTPVRVFKAEHQLTPDTFGTYHLTHPTALGVLKKQAALQRDLTRGRWATVHRITGNILRAPAVTLAHSASHARVVNPPILREPITRRGRKAVCALGSSW